MSRRDLPRSPSGWSRRELIAGGALALAGLQLARSARGWSGPPADRRWPLDADGDGLIGAADREIVAAALGRRRGTGLTPLPGWDPRADLLGTGVIDEAQLRALEAGPLPAALAPRPMVAAFHYGWYRNSRRREQTVRYRGGNYVSSSRRTEEEFNRLKAEFGIGADLLSWIEGERVLGAYERGYLAAGNVGSRRFGLLYETVINLGGEDARLPFGPETDTGTRLAASFGRMGTWAARARDRGAPVLEMDGRPVVYIFASHLFGTTDDELPWVGEALLAARRNFAEAFGAPPFLIGDESPFPGDPGVERNRAFRARWMDAVTRYHHYDGAEAEQLAPSGGWRLDAEHRARLIVNERRAIDGFREIRNEITGRRLLVIPSAAAGFAKTGLPTLRASEDDYLAYLRDIQELTDEHLTREHEGDWPGPALVLAGSWNEEFEGHALLPAARNEALIESGRSGFEWLWALRRLYGWNHHGPVAALPLPRA